MKHGTSVDELNEALHEIKEVELIGHYGAGWHASIKYAMVEGMFNVYDHDELRVSTLYPSSAVEEYNSIRPR